MPADTCGWKEDGAVRLEGKLAPDDGVIVMNAIRARRESIFNDARRDGRREPPQAYAADALVSISRDALSGSSGTASGKSSTVVKVVVDYETFVTAKKRQDTRCEITGAGPIPAALARSMAVDSFLKAVVMKGEDIHSVVHLGRAIPAHVRTALEIRDPSCRVDGCGATENLEIDHYKQDFALGGKTCLDNLVRLCRFHHRQKTLEGYRIVGGPGSWRWLTPDDLEGDPDDPDPPPDG